MTINVVPCRVYWCKLDWEIEKQSYDRKYETQQRHTLVIAMRFTNSIAEN